MSLNQELKQLIVDALQLEDVTPDAIGDADPLFGGGLELATAIARTYDVQITADPETREAFHSVNHLAAYITKHRARE